MAIRSGQIIGYSWEVWYEGSCLHEDNEIFDTEEEARHFAREYCEDKIVDWENDGAELDGSELEELLNGITINDIFADDEEEDRLW